MLCISQGPATSSAAKTARILGTKVRVCSLIWVSAWKTLMSRPTRSAAAIIGAASMTVIMRALRPISSANSSFIGTDSPHSLALLRRGGPTPSPSPLRWRGEPAGELSWFWLLEGVRTGPLAGEAGHQRTGDQVPAVRHHEQEHLEGQGDRGRREHHHAHRHQ